MTLAARESSRFSGEPVTLYLFVYGESASSVLSYTDAEQPISSGVNPVNGAPLVYAPIPIDRGKIAISGTLDKASLTISTPVNTDLAQLYLKYPPSSKTGIVIRQGHIADNDFKVVWTGRVMSCQVKSSQANFSCEPSSTSLRRNGLRRRYQYGCPLVLYGLDCRASKAAATVTATVTSVSGSRVTLAEGWAGQALAAKYLQGLAEWFGSDGNREIRTVLRVEGAGRTFLLSGPVRGILPGDDIAMVLGCNHKSGTAAQPDGDCGPLHSNIQNFGGQERIPFKNPIGSFSNNFY